MTDGSLKSLEKEREDRIAREKQVKATETVVETLKDIKEATSQPTILGTLFNVIKFLGLPLLAVGAAIGRIFSIFSRLH